MANSHVSLTNGACLRLIEQDADLEGFQPVLQCLSLKKLGAASTASGMPDRYRCASRLSLLIRKELGHALTRVVQYDHFRRRPLHPEHAQYQAQWSRRK